MVIFVISTEAQRKEKSHPRARTGIPSLSARVRFLASLEMTNGEAWLPKNSKRLKYYDYTNVIDLYAKNQTGQTAARSVSAGLSPRFRIGQPGAHVSGCWHYLY